MKKALLVTTDRYPNGDAGAVRTHTFAKMLQSLGYAPTVVGMGSSTQFEFCEDDGITYTSFRLSSPDIVSRIKERMLFHKRLKRTLLKHDHCWDVIIVSLVSRKTMNVLKRYAKKNNVPLLHDSVEWYSPEQFSLGRFHPSYIAMERRNRRDIDRTVRVIAISSYLEKHFQSKGILTARIPVIMDMQKMPFEKQIEQDNIVFSYVGSPGKKDYLDVIVKGFALAAEKHSTASYELRIIGVTKEQLLNICDKYDVERIESHLRCYGRIPREEALKHLSQTDFTVLMRSEEQRYAKAGFPTKFVESLATATPIICNATSDIAEYLQDGENGFLVSDGSASALAESLNKALNIAYEERLSMQETARKTAEKYFDYPMYAETVQQLIHDILM